MMIPDPSDNQKNLDDMKGKNYLITYLSALVIGILLLIFHDRDALYNTVVLVIGILIALPSLILLITELARKPKGDSSPGYAGAIRWSSAVAALAGVAFGIWMIVNPALFVSAIIYTLGAILILVGLAQMFAIYLAAKPLRPAIGWYVIPILTLLAGIVIIILGPAKVSSCAGLITGIMLVVYAANGFASAGREAKESADVRKLEAGVAEESAKAKN